jgi:hypothetical protein
MFGAMTAEFGAKAQPLATSETAAAAEPPEAVA